MPSNGRWDLIRQLKVKLANKDWIWTCQAEFSIINIHKNFNSQLYAISLLLNVMWALQGYLFWWEWSDIAHVLSIFTIRSFLQNLNSNCCIINFILCWSASSSLSTTSILLSSAYKTKLTHWKTCGKLLIYKRNRRGTKIKPWGTLCKFTLNEDEYLFNMTFLPLVCVNETYCVCCNKT